MTKSAKLNNSSIPATIDMAAMWQEAMGDDDFRFEIKAQSVAIDLVKAISHCGLTQSEVAKKLNWSPSRVSKVLHGSSNITLRTIYAITEALELQFDIIYRSKTDECSSQPWDTTVRVSKALLTCKEIEKLQERTQNNYKQSEAMLDIAKTLNRRSWCTARTTTVSSEILKAA